MKNPVIIKLLCLVGLLACGIGLYIYLQPDQEDKDTATNQEPEARESWAERKKSASTKPAEPEEDVNPSPKPLPNPLLRPNPDASLEERRKAFLERRKQNEALAKAAKENPNAADDAASRERRAEMARRRAEQIDQAVKDGRLGPMEAEFRKLMMNRGDDPQAHRDALTKWRQENGDALAKERQSLAEARAATRGQDMAAAAERRNQMIDRAVTEGRMGPLEAERMKLMQAQGANPEERRKILSEWHQQNGAALKQEIENRRNKPTKKSNPQEIN